jgi:HEAT repeats
MNPVPDQELQQAATQSDRDPFSVGLRSCRLSRRALVLFGGVILLLAVGVGTGSAQSVWQHIAQFIGLRGKPEPASASVLSEHEIAELDKMSPQSQAALLLQRSINHYRGANDQIAARVDRWRGKIQLDQQLGSLFSIALNSDDLGVRAAALEVDLASYNLEKASSSIDSLESAGRFGEQPIRVDALWKIALLGNRGVEPGRAFEIVSASIDDSNENIRYWAVEGLAYLGTDETIEPLLGVFHDDRSANIRERAACGLAQSGMLSEKQRRTAVPKLLDFADDRSLDPQTREWVFQALRDITGQTLPHDANAWRNWYSHNDERWTPVTRDSQ